MDIDAVSLQSTRDARDSVRFQYFKPRRRSWRATGAHQPRDYRALAQAPTCHHHLSAEVSQAALRRGRRSRLRRSSLSRSSETLPAALFAMRAMGSLPEELEPLGELKVEPTGERRSRKARRPSRAPQPQEDWRWRRERRLSRVVLGRIPLPREDAGSQWAVNVKSRVPHRGLWEANFVRGSCWPRRL